MKKILNIGFCIIFASYVEAGNLRKLVDTFNGRPIHSELSNGCFRVFVQNAQDCRGKPAACDSLGDEGECTPSGWMYACTVVDCPGGNRGETGPVIGPVFPDLLPSTPSPSVSPPVSQMPSLAPTDGKKKKKKKKKNGSQDYADVPNRV